MFCGPFHQKDLKFHTLMVFFRKRLLQSCIFHQNISPNLASTRKVRLTLLWLPRRLSDCNSGTTHSDSLFCFMTQNLYWTILPSFEHNSLKWSCGKCNTQRQFFFCHNIVISIIKGKTTMLKAKPITPHTSGIKLPTRTCL